MYRNHSTPITFEKRRTKIITILKCTVSNDVTFTTNYESTKLEGDVGIINGDERPMDSPDRLESA